MDLKSQSSSAGQIPLAQSLFLLFKNPDDIPYCGRVLLSTFDNSLHGITASKGEKGLRRSHELFNFILRFLVTHRTDEEVRRLLDKLADCSCDMDHTRAYHEQGARRERQLLDRTCAKNAHPGSALIIQFFSTLENAMENSKVKSVAKGISGTWPSCPQDLMPWGADNVMASLDQWTRFTPDTIVVKIVAHVHHFCGHVFLNSILAYHFTHKVVDFGRALFDRVANSLRDGSAPSQPRLGAAFVMQLENLFFFFDKSFELPIGLQIRLLDGYEMKYVQMCSLLAYLASDCRLSIYDRDRVLQYSVHRGAVVYYLFNCTVRAWPDVQVHPELYKTFLKISKHGNPKDFGESLSSGDVKTAADSYGCIVDSRHGLDIQNPEPHQSIEGPIVPNRTLVANEPTSEVGAVTHRSQELGEGSSSNQEAWHTIASAVIREIRDTRTLNLQCTARQCLNALHNKGRQCQRCARCNIALYCSKECQIRAWNSETYPHKQVCKTLQQLVETGGGQKAIFRETSDPNPEIGESIVAAWKEAGISRMDLLQVSNWFNSNEISFWGGTKDMVGPGYGDYDAMVEEMVKTGGRPENAARRLVQIPLGPFIKASPG